MANFVSFVYLIVCCWIWPVRSQFIDYYWREYNGAIPEDAVLGGKNAAGKDIYIGLVYVHDYGEIVAPIISENSEVEFSCYGVRKVRKFIKILCSKHKNNFEWLNTTAQTLHLDTINKYVVNGGHDARTDGIYNIGRTMYDGSSQIGAIRADRIGIADLNFVHKGELHDYIENYEVLIYNPDNDNVLFNIDIRTGVPKTRK